jgi:hypothetical protein
MPKQCLCLMLSLILTSSSNARADAYYITNDLFDPELSKFETRKEAYLYWPDAPDKGIFMQFDDFKQVTGCLKSCKDLEIEGLNSLPRTALVDPGPHFSPEALYFLAGIVIGAAIVYVVNERAKPALARISF